MTKIFYVTAGLSAMMLTSCGGKVSESDSTQQGAHESPVVVANQHDDASSHSGGHDHHHQAKSHNQSSDDHGKHNAHDAKSQGDHAKKHQSHGHASNHAHHEQSAHNTHSKDVHKKGSPGHGNHPKTGHDNHQQAKTDKHHGSTPGKEKQHHEGHKVDQKAQVQEHKHDASHGSRQQPSDKLKEDQKTTALDVPDKSEFDGLSATEIFQRRMLPIMNSTQSSSCTQCHFSGVELRDFILPDQAKTFASLRAAEMIDTNKPDESKILRFIARRPSKSDKLMAKVREQEYIAFRAWIRAAVKDPELLKATAGTEKLGTSLPVEVVRHARKDRVLDSFIQNIWSEMGRCVNCHSPELNRRMIGRNGRTKEDIDAISWVVPRDPAATLQQLVDTGNIDTDAPDKSYVLTKPAGLEEHGGGPKFAVGSRTDKNFRRFLNDYAKIVNQEYKSANQLPEPSKEMAMLTGQHLRIVDLPESFEKKLLRADIYRMLDSGWSKDRWATAENPIAGKRKMWQSMVMAVAPQDSKRAKELKPETPLPDGQYLIKIYIDRRDKTKANRDYELGESEFYGQVEIHGPWKPGYQPPKIVHAPIRD